MNRVIISETDRLMLRHFDADDAVAMMWVFGDEEVMEYGPGVQSAEWVRGWIRGAMAEYSTRGFGPWAITETSTGNMIGYAGLFYFPDVNGKPEIETGYRLARAYWNRGYATEALVAVIDYAFNVLKLPRLIAMIDPQNTASLRVAHKAGMKYEAEVMFDGYTHPDHVYVIMQPGG